MKKTRWSDDNAIQVSQASHFIPLTTEACVLVPVQDCSACVKNKFMRSKSARRTRLAVPPADLSDQYIYHVLGSIFLMIDEAIAQRSLRTTATRPTVRKQLCSVNNDEKKRTEANKSGIECRTTS